MLQYLRANSQAPFPFPCMYLQHVHMRMESDHEVLDLCLTVAHGRMLLCGMIIGQASMSGMFSLPKSAGKLLL
jgi:hypothetical protein